MKVVNCYTTKTVTYDIQMDVGDDQERVQKNLTYKEYWEGNKVIDETLEDEDGQSIFDEELLDKVRAMCDNYQAGT